MKKNQDLHNTLIPVVVEKEGAGYERSYDIYSRLLKDFIIFVTGPIDMATANTFIAQMLFLESSDPTRDIKIYINSPGGEAYSGRAMFDTVRHVKNDVVTINTGLCASAAALLLCSGTKGKRYSLPGAHTMIHQTLGGAEGQATDIEIYAKLIAGQADKPFEQVLLDIERDNWMSAEETKEYGIIDNILEPAKK